MKRWVIHGLHLLLIAVLVILIAWNQIRSGEYILFENLGITFKLTLSPIEDYNKQLLADIQESVEPYPSGISLDYFRRAIALQGQCDSAIVYPKYRRNSNAVLLQNLPKLYDTLAVYVDKEPELLQYFDASLLQIGGHAWAPKSNHQHSSQQQMLWKALTTKVHFAKLATLHYINAKLGGTGIRCFFSAPIFRQTDLLCPQVSQAFRTTLFLSSFDKPPIQWYPLRDKIWINEQPIRALDAEAGEFRTTFPTPGPHPLHIRIEKWNIMTNSTQVFEKTYTVNVLP